MKRPTRTRYLALLAMSLIICGCPDRTEIWLAPGATAANLSFQLGRHVNEMSTISLASFDIVRCDGASAGGSAVWHLQARGRAPRVDHVNYGVTPDGFVATVNAPEKLDAGCYVAESSGTGTIRFTVNTDGTVQETAR